MLCKKICNLITSSLLPLLILSIHLLQIYSQYSTIITLRDQIYSEKDGRKTITNYSLIKDKFYVFNLNKIKECFNDNCLMKINFIKNMFLNIFNNNNDIRIYMFYYLLIYDIICIIILYLFVFGSIKFGLLKIALQFFRFCINSQRMQNYNNKLSLFEIIKNKIDNMCSIRQWNFFNPEGFFVIEFLCNVVIFLDIIYLLMLICLRINKKNKTKFKLSKKIEDDDDKKSSDKNTGKNNKKSLEKKNNYKIETKNPFENNYYNNDYRQTLSGESISSSDEEITKQ